jgi:filamentous hemagglutinin family protein
LGLKLALRLFSDVRNYSTRFCVLGRQEEMMTTRISYGPHRAVLAAVLLNAAGVLLSVGYAQVTTNITSSGLGTTVSQAGTTWNITGGTRPENGSNLFHSFGLFSIGAGNTAQFNNTTGPGVANILSRVTGGQSSQILGTINTSTGFPGANFYLLNPAGILFGRNAQLDVGGSFHASTGDYVKFEDGRIFYADPAKASVLTSAPPSAFGFLTSNPAAIDVQTGMNPFTNRLQVAVGKTLSLVGGPVNVGEPSGQSPMGSGFVFAPGGVVNIASVASPGEATFATGINVDAFAKLGEIHITGRAVVDGREINIRGGRLEITDATLFPGFFFLFGGAFSSFLRPNGGQVSIRVTDDVTITGTRPALIGGILPGIQTFAGEGPFAIGGFPGDVPGVNIEAGRLSMSGMATIQTSRSGPGNPATVVITADTIDLHNGASIVMSNRFGGGPFPTGGGTLTINGNNMTLSSDGSPSFTGIAATPRFGFLFGVVGSSDPFSPSVQLVDSASVRINLTGNLTVRGNAGITTDNLAFGPAGAINVTAANILLDGAGQSGVVSAQGGIAGESGSVRLRATGNIDVQNGFLVSASTGGSGNGGAVELSAGKSINLGANSRISSGTSPLPDAELNSFARRFDAFFQVFFRTPIPDYASLRKVLGVAPAPGDLMQVLAKLNAITDRAGNPLVAVTDFTPGDAGRISITTPLLTMNAGLIETSTGWDGNAGNISLSANQVNIQNGGSVTSESGGTLAGQFFGGSGNAGQITVSTPTLTMADGSVISVKTSGGGNAPGNILLNVGNFTQTGGARVDSSTSGAGRGGDLTVTANSVSISGPGTGLFSTASGSGAGGNIKIQAGKLVQLTDGGTISAQSTGTATSTAGNININTPTFQSQNGSVTTGATLADGGDISIATTGSLVRLTDSQITTSVESGAGSGGNIAIDSKLIVLDDSQILARAVLGHGGKIDITGDLFLVNSGGRAPLSLAGIVDASSELSTPGTIDIEAAFTNVTGSVTRLPETPLQATELLRASCAARFAGGKASSLVLGGRDGLPLQPGDLLPSPLYVTGLSSGDNGLTAEETPLRFTLFEPKDRLLNKYSLLPNAKCSL